MIISLCACFKMDHIISNIPTVKKHRKKSMSIRKTYHRFINNDKTVPSMSILGIIKRRS
jgi:hypothetical protein